MRRSLILIGLAVVVRRAVHLLASGAVTIGSVREESERRAGTINADARNKQQDSLRDA